MKSLDHVTIHCAREGCYAVITLHPQEEHRLRSTHEQFYCPAGHSNYFPGKTPQEERVDELERDLRNLRRSLERAHDRTTSQHQLITLVARGAATCPLGCGWTTRRQLRGAWSGDDEAARRYLDRVGHDLAEHLQLDHHASPRVVAGLLTAGDPEPALPGERERA